MEFKPEDAGNGILPDGEYNFEVVTSEDTISKFNDGEEQIQLNLRIFHEGGVIFLNQWLSPSKTWKIKQFAYAVGISGRFESGKITAADCLDKAGKLKLGQYEDKSGTKRNSVFKYLESETSSAEVKDALKTFKATAKVESELPDDMPF
jgi:hypothetical protein